MIENDRTEFKLLWKDDILKNIVAFANAEGGDIYLGVNDAGEAVGLPLIEEMLEKLPNIINSKIGLYPQIKAVSINGKTDEKPVLQITILPSSVPISYNGKFYFRSGSVVLELSDRALSDFLLKKSGQTWDGLEADVYHSLQFNLETIEHFKKLSKDRLPAANNEEIEVNLFLQKLNLLSQNGRPTKAAILLFAKNVPAYFLQAKIKIGRFASESDIVTSDVIEGNLFEQIELAITVLKSKYLLSPISYEGIHRREKLIYPEEALREAILNAMIHRDYNSTSNILIHVFYDRLTITNEGKFPPEVSVNDLGHTHLSKPRNRLLADTFYKAGYIESWGRGTLNIIKACEEAKLPPPLFTEDHGTIRICFFNGVGGEVTDQVTDQVTDNQAKILEIIKNNPHISTKELEDNVGISQRKIKENIKKLKLSGHLERVGTNKKGHWRILK